MTTRRRSLPHAAMPCAVLASIAATRAAVLASKRARLALSLSASRPNTSRAPEKLAVQNARRAPLGTLIVLNPRSLTIVPLTGLAVLQLRNVRGPSDLTLPVRANRAEMRALCAHRTIPIVLRRPTSKPAMRWASAGAELPPATPSASQVQRRFKTATRVIVSRDVGSAPTSRATVAERAGPRTIAPTTSTARTLPVRTAAKPVPPCSACRGRRLATPCTHRFAGVTASRTAMPALLQRRARVCTAKASAKTDLPATCSTKHHQHGGVGFELELDGTGLAFGAPLEQA